MEGQTKWKEKKNKIVQVSNFKQEPVPKPTFHSLSVTHNFYFSADLHRTRKISSQRCRPGHRKIVVLRGLRVQSYKLS